MDVLAQECRAASGSAVRSVSHRDISSRFIIEFIKNDQTAFEADMALNMGQLLSIPFVIAGIVLVIWSLCRPKVEIAFPDRYADEPSDGKRRR